jgi:hypothetical protein
MGLEWDVNGSSMDVQRDARTLQMIAAQEISQQHDLGVV